jgi:hypothetical protein
MGVYFGEAELVDFGGGNVDGRSRYGLLKRVHMKTARKERTACEIEGCRLIDSISDLVYIIYQKKAKPWESSWARAAEFPVA